MYNKVISIEVGSQRTKICEVAYRQKKAHVYHFISFDTPEDTFDDGYIRDKEKFVAVVKDKLQESNMKSKKVVFTIASSKIANKEVTIPLIKEKRIQDVIEANASDYFPVQISEYTLTYCILEKMVSTDSKKLRLSVFAAPNSLIKNYYSIGAMLDLDVIAIDYIGNSAYQILKKQQSTKTELIIQMNEQTTLISVLRGEILKLQRTVPYGTASVIEAVLHNRFFVVENETQAIQLLSNRNLINNQIHVFNDEVAATINPDEDYMNNQTLRSDITDSLNLLINNILRVIDYYSSRYQSEKIEAIYITGQGSRFRGMRELLHQETGIVVEILQELPSVIFPKDVSISKMEQSEYIGPIGAVVRSINFLPKELLINEKKQSRVNSRIIMLLASLIISVILVVTSYLNLISEEKIFEQLNQQIESLSTINKVYLEHAYAKNQYSLVKEMYDATSNPNQNLGNLITELEQKLPSKSSIDTLVVSSTNITLSVKADSKETAAKVLQQLKTFDSISQINTSGITEEDDKNDTITVRFIVTAKYNTASKEDNDENSK